MNFGNIGLTGLLLIVVVLLIFWGPSKLPEIGKAFGRSLKEFREATHGLTEDVETRSSAKVIEAPTTHAAVQVQPIELVEPVKEESSKS